MYVDTSYCFVSNFGEGSISIADINLYKEIRRLMLEECLEDLLKIKDYIYIGDNYSNCL
jgi:hypothetical protein